MFMRKVMPAVHCVEEMVVGHCVGEMTVLPELLGVAVSVMLLVSE